MKLKDIKLKDLPNAYLNLLEQERLRMEQRKMTERMFGRTAEEILKALEFYDGCCYDPKCPANQKEQSKMTREEAVKKISDKVGTHYDPTTILNVLQALGLFKFEEKKVESTNKITPEQIIRNYYIYPEQVINHLVNAGYVIVQQQLKPKEAKTETKSGCFDSGYLTFGSTSISVQTIIDLMAMKGYTVTKRDCDGTSVR